jgi:hypothetical protein
MSSFDFKDKAREIDALQAKADRFSQFLKNANKEILSSGQSLMQFVKDFSSISSGVSSANPTAQVDISSGNVRDFMAHANRNGRGPGDRILQQSRIMENNARQAHVNPVMGAIMEETDVRAATLSSVAGALNARDDFAAAGGDDYPATRFHKKFARGSRKDRPAAREAFEYQAAARQPDLALEQAGNGIGVAGALNIKRKFEQQLPEIEGRIAALQRSSGPESSGNKIVADQLKDLVGKSERANQVFATALAKVEATPKDITKDEHGGEKYVAATVELAEAIKGLTESTDKLDSTNKHAAKLPGGRVGGNEPRDPTLYEKARPWAALAGASLGAAAAIAAGGLATSISMDQAGLGAERRGATAAGGIARDTTNRFFESTNMTNPENLLRYRANQVFGRDFDYIGTNPRKLGGAIGQELQTEVGISKKQMYSTIIGSSAQILGGAGAVAMGIGGAGVTGGMSAAAIPGGVQAIGTGFTSAAGELANNRAAMLSHGAMEGTFLGRLMRGSVEADRRAGLNKNAAVQEMSLEALETRRKLEDADLAKLSLYMPAMQEIEKMKDAQREGASMVGRWGATAIGLNNQIYGRSIATAEKLDDINLSNRSGDIDNGAGFSEKAQGNVTKLLKERKREERKLKKLEKIAYDFDEKHGYHSMVAEDSGLHRTAIEMQVEAKRKDPTAWGIHEKTQATIYRLREKVENLNKSIAADPNVNAGTLEQAAENLEVSKGRVVSSLDKGLFTNTIKDMESGGRYDLKNIPKKGEKASTAFGAYQFIAATRKTLEKRLGYEPGTLMRYDATGRTAQDAAFSNIYEEYRRTALAYAEDKDDKVKAAAKTYTTAQLMAGIQKGGGSAMHAFLETGVDKSGIQGYIKTFSGKYGGPGPGGPGPGAPTQPGNIAQVDSYSQVTNMLSRLDISGDQLLRYQNTLSNVIGDKGGIKGGGQAGLGDVESMVRLSRAGVGDFSALAGNIAGINKVSGGQNNLAQLEQVMSNAVANGFGKSHMAQAFMQISTELARSLQVTSVSRMSDTLTLGAKAFSVSGDADALSLSKAASGIQEYGGHTAQRTGLVGAMKMAAVFAAGGTLAGGAGLLQGASSAQASGYLAELDSGKIVSRELNDMINAHGGKTEGVKKEIQAYIRASGMDLRGQYNINRYGSGRSYESDLARLKTLQKADKGGESHKVYAQALGKFESDMNIAGASVGLTSGGGAAAALDVEVAEGLRGPMTPAEKKAALDKAKNLGAAVGVDPARQAQRAFLNSTMVDLRNKATGISESAYRQYLTATGGQAVDGITLDKLDSKDAKVREGAREKLQHVNTLEMTRNVSEAAVAGRVDVQKVTIENPEILAGYIANAMLGKKEQPKPAAEKKNNQGKAPGS